MLQTYSLTWYPGGTHTITERPHSLIYDFEIAVGSLYIDEDSRTLIDYHVNVPVVGNHACMY